MTPRLESVLAKVSELDFKIGLHVAGVLSSYPGDDLLAGIKHPKVREVAEAFLNNVVRVVKSVRSPIEMVMWSSALQSWNDQASVEVFGHFEATEGPLEAQNREAFKRIQAKDLADLEDHDFLTERLLRSAWNLEILQKHEQISTGVAAALAGMVTGTWTIVEVLVGDLWETALNAHPVQLAELKGKPPASMPRPKRPFMAFALPEGDKKATPKLVRLDYLQAHGYDLSDRMGTVLREKFNFQVIQGIREAYVQAFDDSHTAVRDAILHPCFTALAASRNVLVHRVGIADEDFMDTFEHCDALRAALPDSEVGKPLTLTGPTVKSLVHPAIEQCDTLIRAVNEVIGR
jgi:hypothetical protein